jgi:ankyrin repeat protein
LIKKGANVNALQQGGFTALHAAAQNGNLDLCKLLIEAGADMNARTTEGQTALDFAVKSGSPVLSQYFSAMSKKNRLDTI